MEEGWKRRGGRADWGASVHDDSQVELTVDYTAERSEPEAQRYEVDLFLVAPAAVALDRATYPKERFWADLTQRMRLHTPPVPAFSRGEIPSLDQYLALGLDLGAKRRLEPRVVQDVKLFASHVNHVVKQTFDGTRPRAGHSGELERAIAIVAGFRDRYVGPVERGGLTIGEDVRQTVQAADEYLADRLQRSVSRAAIAGALQARAISFPHRRPAPGRDSEALEQYGIHQSQLKKLVSEILYLHPRFLHRDRWVRNGIAAVGAALAAMFAETARLYNRPGTTDLGLPLAVFLFVGVVAYVFKDRLKDLTKEYFGRKMRSHLPDRESVLAVDWADPVGGAMRVDVAHHGEWVRHTSTAELPPDVRYVWSRMQDAPGSPRAIGVLHYAKVVELRPEALGLLELDALAVKDVMRFDVSAFLSHLDNPLKELALLDDDEGAVVVRGPKVYHLDVVLRLRCGDDVGVEAVRVVLDKQGLVRLDRPVAPGRYRYEVGA